MWNTSQSDNGHAAEYDLIRKDQIIFTYLHLAAVEELQGRGLNFDFKLIIDEAAPRYRLFNLREDPQEKRDLAKDNASKDKLTEMKKLAEEAWSKHPFVKPFGSGKKLVGGVRAAMGYTGSADIATMHNTANFVRITGAGLKESHVHDVQITRESPNYRLG